MVEPRIEINPALYLKNPENSELGQKIIRHSVSMIHAHGFEAFTFRKLAQEIESTEAGIYRYFENKHRLLVYLTSWYWQWLDFHIAYHTNNITDPAIKLRMVISLLASPVQHDAQNSHIDQALLHQIIIAEGSKAYLTKHVKDDNRQHFFRPYKQLCATVGNIISENNPQYPYPRSLASTILEMAHFQNYFMHNLPSLTDFGAHKEEGAIEAFLNDLVFSVLHIGKR